MQLLHITAPWTLHWNSHVLANPCVSPHYRIASSICLPGWQQLQQPYAAAKLLDTAPVSAAVAACAQQAREGCTQQGLQLQLLQV